MKKWTVNLVEHELHLSSSGLLIITTKFVHIHGPETPSFVSRTEVLAFKTENIVNIM